MIRLVAYPVREYERLHLLSRYTNTVTQRPVATAANHPARNRIKEPYACGAAIRLTRFSRVRPTNIPTKQFLLVNEGQIRQFGRTYSAAVRNGAKAGQDPDALIAV
jgi:hypothetical protein